MANGTGARVVTIACDEPLQVAGEGWSRRRSSSLSVSGGSGRVMSACRRPRPSPDPQPERENCLQKA